MSSRKITLKKDIKLKDVNGKAVRDQALLAFSIARNLQIGYFLTFKEIAPSEFGLIIF
jgi:hypothetical protein